MITIDKSTATSYTFLVEGNSGENQLIITCSPSQCGKGPLMIVSNAVDGGPIEILQQSAWVGHSEIPGCVERVLNIWTKSGRLPTAEQQKTNDKAIKSVMTKFKKHFFFDG